MTTTSRNDAAYGIDQPQRRPLRDRNPSKLDSRPFFAYSLQSKPTFEKPDVGQGEDAGKPGAATPFRDYQSQIAGLHDHHHIP